MLKVKTIGNTAIFQLNVKDNGITKVWKELWSLRRD